MFELTDTQKSQLRITIGYYGIEKQFRQTQEEAAELIAAINHYLRGKSEGAYEDLVEEIADTYIMLLQLRTVIREEDFNKQVEKKLKRQRLRLKQDMEANYSIEDIKAITDGGNID